MQVPQRRTDVAYGNPVICERALDKAHRVHEEFVRKAKPIVDCGAPQVGHSLALYGKDYVFKKKITTQNAFNDLKMIQNIARTMTRPFSIPPRPGPASLNRVNRKRDVARINAENAKILARLETLKPQISAKQQLQEYDRSQRYMVNSSFSMRKDIEKKLKLHRSLSQLRAAGSSPLPPHSTEAPVVASSSSPVQFIHSRPADDEDDDRHQEQTETI
jgi:hypothetical protein